MPTLTIEGYPLSLQQKRSWKLFSEAGASATKSRLEIAIEGKIDRPVLERAVREVFRRHEICRCVLANVPGAAEPLQVVVDEDRGGNSTEGSRVEWALRMEGDGTQALYVCFPAPLVDDTSLELFLAELAQAYHREISGGGKSGEPMQYLDYAQWQLELQSSPEGRMGRQFWNRPERAEMILPLEKQERGFESACEIQTLDAATREAVENCATTHSVGKEIVVGTAWVAFLSRLNEDETGAIGFHSPGRTFEELHDALGMYDVFLPLELELPNGTTPAGAIRAISRAYSEAKGHQEFFGGSKLNLEANSFLFAYRKAISEIASGEARWRVRHLECHTEPFKLKLEYQEADSPEIRLYYNAIGISAGYSAILAKRFKTFLSEFIGRADVPISELKNISAREWELVVKEFPRSPAADLGEPTVIHRFMNGVAQHPQRPAVICGGRMLSYRELNGRANQLARQLVKLGVGGGAPVAISAERSADMIVGLLGIQKAGGAYVPLDPGYPKNRLSFILKDCGARVLVAQPHLTEKLPAHQCDYVPLGGSSVEEGASQDVPEPEIELKAEDAAYIIYTSGSTGQPKGVQITHHNLACSTAARFEYYKEPIANYLLLSSFAFDSSIAGIFWALAQGGTLTLPREGMHQDPHHLLRLVTEYKVSHLLGLPSFYQAILQQVRNGELASIRTVIVAGEACTPQLVQRHYSILPEATLFNEYGPTEGTVWATVHRCRPDEMGGTVPIGRPVPNMWLYILDEQRKAVGIGQLGEIYIGGPAVARGYMNRNDLTGQKFVENPFGEESGEIAAPQRLYRTGDLGRFRVDGVVEFHGRIDEQVKVRGYRIEVGEIESVLREHPGVEEAAVVARDDGQGEKRLVAYLVAHESSGVSLPEVRLVAQEKLPAFMVPAQFVVLSELPLTPNGKVDRNALPAPEEVELGRGELVAPRTAEEEMLAKIWAEVLKLEQVGLGQNFFDLGGHSLLAIQVIARVRDSFKVEFPMAAFFESPTIDGMAAALGKYRERTGTGEIRRATRVVASESLLAQLGDGPSE